MKTIETLYTLSSFLLNQMGNPMALTLKTESLIGETEETSAVTVMNQARSRIDELFLSIQLVQRARRRGDKQEIEDAEQGLLELLVPEENSSKVVQFPQGNMIDPLELTANKQRTKRIVRSLDSANLVEAHHPTGVLEIKSPWGGESGSIRSNPDFTLSYSPGRGDESKTLKDLLSKIYN